MKKQFEVTFWNSKIEQICKYIGEMEAKFLTVGDWVTNMKRGEDSMNPVALDWNWRYLCKLMDVYISPISQLYPPRGPRSNDAQVNKYTSIQILVSEYFH